jgi:uncharacterized protein DUF4395
MPAIFLALGVVLAVGVLAPRWNLFDALYTRLIARARGLPPAVPAPAPRRFAQAIATIFMLAIGVALWSGALFPAYLLEALLVVFLVLLVFGKFCMGSWLYGVLTGRRTR